MAAPPASAAAVPPAVGGVEMNANSLLMGSALETTIAGVCMLETS